MFTDLDLNEIITEDIRLLEDEYEEPMVSVYNLELTGQETRTVARFDFSINTDDGLLRVKDCELFVEPEGRIWVAGYAKRWRSADGDHYWCPLVTIPGRVKSVLLPMAIEAYTQARSEQALVSINSDIPLAAFSHEPFVIVRNFRKTPQYKAVYAVFDVQIDDWFFRNCNITNDPSSGCYPGIEVGPGRLVDGQYKTIVDFPESIRISLGQELWINVP